LGRHFLNENVRRNPGYGKLWISDMAQLSFISSKPAFLDLCDWQGRAALLRGKYLHLVVHSSVEKIYRPFSSNPYDGPV